MHPESVRRRHGRLWLGGRAGDGGGRLPELPRQCGERALALFERLGERATVRRRVSGPGRLRLLDGGGRAGSSPRRPGARRGSGARRRLPSGRGARRRVARSRPRPETTNGRRWPSTRRSLSSVRLGVPRRLWVHQLINVGWIAIHRHDFVRAREALEEYLAAESWKNPIGIANGHGNLGLVAVYEGDRDEADRRCRQALVHARAPRANPTIAEALFGLGAVAAMDGDDERAVRLRGAADGLKAAMEVAALGARAAHRRAVPGAGRRADCRRTRANEPVTKALR